LSFFLAGDFIGVQQKMRDALWELHRQSPTMGFNITWLTAHEESMVDDTLLSVRVRPVCRFR
jgi:hypothetical protein